MSRMRTVPNSSTPRRMTAGCCTRRRRGRVLGIDFVEVERVVETATVSPAAPRQAPVGRGGPGDHRDPRGAAGQGGSSPNEQVQGVRKAPGEHPSSGAPRGPPRTCQTAAPSGGWSGPRGRRKRRSYSARQEKYSWTCELSITGVFGPGSGTFRAFDRPEAPSSGLGAPSRAHPWPWLSSVLR